MEFMGFHRRVSFSWMLTNFTVNVTAMKSWIRLLSMHYIEVCSILGSPSQMPWMHWWFLHCYTAVTLCAYNVIVIFCSLATARTRLTMSSHWTLLSNVMLRLNAPPLLPELTRKLGCVIVFMKSRGGPNMKLYCFRKQIWWCCFLAEE